MLPIIHIRLTPLALALLLIGSPAYANPFDPFVPLLPVLGDGQWQDGTHVFELDAPADGSELLLLGLAGSGGNRGQLSLTVNGSNLATARVRGVISAANGASFVNHGTLHIAAQGDGDTDATGAHFGNHGALANHGSLHVSAQGDGYLHEATGATFGDDGTLANHGSLHVSAQGDGDAYATGATFGNYGALANHGSLHVTAQGDGYLHDATGAIFGDDSTLTNHGSLHVSAQGDGNLHKATGAIFGNDSTLTNQGSLHVSAQGNGNAYTATGAYFGDDGTLTNHGSLHVSAQGNGFVSATGAIFAGDGMLANHGSLHVTAQGSGGAYATGAHFGNRGALANHGMLHVSAQGDGYLYAATGAYFGHDGALTNQGSLHVTAQGDGDVNATGATFRNDGALANHGSLHVSAQGDGDADATGATFWDDGELTNHGSLQITAQGDGDAEALGARFEDDGALANHGSLQITAQGDGDAEALGARFEDDGALANHGTLHVTAQGDGNLHKATGATFGDDGELTNHGSLHVTAQSTGSNGYTDATGARFGENGTLTNHGSLDVTAQSTGRDGPAYATGAQFEANNSTLTNHGSITVTAQSARDAAGADFWAADAAGAWFEANNSTLTNHGSMTVTASSPQGDAAAYGVYVNGDNATIEHHGLMHVSAKAGTGGNAQAIGLLFSGGGTHTLDATGRIEVAASGGNNTAHEVLLSGGQLDVSRYHLGVGAPAADESLRAFRVEDSGTLNFADTKLILSPGTGFDGNQQFKLADHISASDNATVSGSIAGVESVHRMLAASLAGSSWDTAEMTLSLADGAHGSRTDALAASYATDSARALLRPLNAAIAAGNSSFVTPLYRHVEGDEDGGWRANTSGALLGFNRALGEGSWGMDFSVENDRFQRSDAYMQGSRNTADRFGVGVHALRTLPNDTTLRAGARYQYADIDVLRHDRELAARASADMSAHSLWLYGTVSRPLGSYLALEGSLDQLWYRQDGYRLGWDNPSAQWADSEIEKVRAASLDAGARLVWQDATHAWQPRAALGARARLHGDSLELNQRFAGFDYTQQAETRRLRGTLELGLARPVAKGALTLDYALEADSERTSQALTLGWRQLF